MPSIGLSSNKFNFILSLKEFFEENSDFTGTKSGTLITKRLSILDFVGLKKIALKMNGADSEI